MHVFWEGMIMLLFLALAFLDLFALSRGIFGKGYTYTPSDWREEFFRSFLQFLLHRG